MNISSLQPHWRIRIVVPVTGANLVQETIDQVRSRSLSSDIALLAPRDDALRATLRQTGAPVEFVDSTEPQGDRYWTGLFLEDLVDDEPTLFVLAGTQVPLHWDARLVAAAQRSAGAWCMSPLCAQHPLLTVFNKVEREPGLDVEAVDQWLNDYVGDYMNDYLDATEFPVPLMLPSCMLVRGQALRDSDAASNDWELLQHLRYSGLDVLATSQVYVDDSRVKYNHGTAHLPQAYLDAYTRRSPLTGLRHSLTQLAARGEAPPRVVPCLPVQLHVGHSWGGGLGRWMEDFIGADVAHNHLVLRSIGDRSAFGQTIALYSSTAMDAPVKSWTLCEPILSVSLGSVEYRAILDELVADFGVESVVVSSLIGHSLDLLDTPLPTTVVLHEFFPFCPALYATFGTPCESCDAARLRECFENNPRNDFFRFDSDAHWLAVRREFGRLIGAGSVTLVAPSESVVARYRALEPALSGRDVHVIPHGIADGAALELRDVGASMGAAAGSDRLVVVVLGRLTAEKGGDILEQVCDALGDRIDFRLLGAGESGSRFKGKPGVSVQAVYEPRDLPSLLRDVSPGVGMLLSTVPETFSYTLSELWAAAVPVIATPFGALAERIEHGVNGWHVGAEADEVVRQLRRLDADRALLSGVRARLLKTQVRDATAMVSDYRQLQGPVENVPLQRYHLPRRSYGNPYRPEGPNAGGRALYVNPQRPYRAALAEFMEFTVAKLENSPGVHPWIRRLGGGVLRLLTPRRGGR